MQTPWKAALVAVVSVVGLGYAAGSLLGGQERLPDVGAPVVLGPGSNSAADDRADEDTSGGIVHPDPEGEQTDAVHERRLERRDLRQDRHDSLRERREARADRRAERDQRRSEPRPAGDGGDDDDGDDRDDGGDGDDDD